MRIIGGIYRHRNIIFPSEKTTRPTKDRIRESLFSSLGDSIVTKRVLDLFAGSGAYGIEALSRGASFCTFVDLENEPIKCIKTNLTTLKVLAPTPPTVDSTTAFRNCPKLTRIEVPSASLEAYKTAKIWSNHANIIVGV